jgi:hypothetical protein
VIGIERTATGALKSRFREPRRAQVIATRHAFLAEIGGNAAT